MAIWINRIKPTAQNAAIVEDSNSRNFCDWAMDAPLEFGKFNLIYGYNGAGKTTLSKRFDWVPAERNHFFSVKNSDDGEIFVFNKDYVKENISLNPIKTVDIEQPQEDSKEVSFGLHNKQTKDAIIIANKNLENLEKNKKKLSEKKEKLDGIYSKHAKIIKDTITSTCNNQYDRFNYYQNYDKKDFRDKIKEGEKEGIFFANLSAVKQGDVLKLISQDSEHKKISTLEFSNRDVDCSSIKDLLLNYKTAEKIPSLINDLEKWVYKGLELHQASDNICKFCDNKISLDRFAKLQKHFNDSFSKIKNKIKEISDYLFAINEIHLPDEDSFLIEFRNDYLNKKTLFGNAKENLVSNAKHLINCLERKDMPTDNLNKLSIQEFIDNINQVIDKNEEKREKIDTLVKRFEESVVVKAFDEYSHIKDEIDRLDENSINEKINREQYEILRLEATLEKSDAFCRIFNEGIGVYLGHEDFSLKPNADKTNYIIMRKGQETDINSVSEGEKTAFVLLYFLFSLKKKESQINNNIVVIDDPISSLDSINLHIAYSFIKKEISKAHQIFILTHNLNFAQRVIQWFNREKNEQSKNLVKFFIMQKKSMGQKPLFEIKEMPPSIRHHCSLMCHLFKTLHDLKEETSNGGELAKSVNAPNVLRQFLEIYVTIWLPSKSPSIEGLKKIWSNVGLSSRKIDSIINFCHHYSHGSPNNDINESLETLLGNDKNFLKSIFKAMEQHNKGFFTALTDSIKNS